MKRGSLARRLAAARMGVLVVLGFVTFTAVSYWNVSLWWILGVGIVSGAIFGKVFCRWVCPLGLMMEMIMNATGNKHAALYQYHKLGCPIAWMSGWLNRVSLFGVRLDSAACTQCGACDKACYIAQIEPQRFSVFETAKLAPDKTFTCSRCLACVTACPSGALTFSPLETGKAPASAIGVNRS